MFVLLLPPVTSHNDLAWVSVGGGTSPSFSSGDTNAFRSLFGFRYLLSPKNCFPKQSITLKAPHTGLNNSISNTH